MSIKKLTIFLLIFYLFISCSKEEVEVSVTNEKSLELQVLEAYKEGIRSLEEGDVIFAAKKFNEVETLFPQSVWAPKSSLMAAYSYYIQDYYPEAIAELERFTRVYPNHENLDYVNYMFIKYKNPKYDNKKYVYQSPSICKIIGHIKPKF